MRETADRRRLTARLLPAIGRTPTAAFAVCLIFALLLGGAAVLNDTSSAQCAGLCQGCYCDTIINGTCIVNGWPSGCIGCVGSCINPGECQCRAGGRLRCGHRLVSGQRLPAPRRTHGHADPCAYPDTASPHLPGTHLRFHPAAPCCR